MPTVARVEVGGVESRDAAGHQFRLIALHDERRVREAEVTAHRCGAGNRQRRAAYGDRFCTVQPVNGMAARPERNSDVTWHVNDHPIQ